MVDTLRPFPSPVNRPDGTVNADIVRSNDNLLAGRVNALIDVTDDLLANAGAGVLEAGDTAERVADRELRNTLYDILVEVEAIAAALGA